MLASSERKYNKQGVYDIFHPQILFIYRTGCKEKAKFSILHNSMSVYSYHKVFSFYFCGEYYLFIIEKQ